MFRNLFDKRKRKSNLIKKKNLESKKIIKEAREKIKLEKRNIKERKREEFRKTKFYKIFNKLFSFIRIDRDTYTFSEVLVVTLSSLVIGAFSCFSVMTIISGGRNYFKLSKELEKFVEVYDTIVENYNGELDKETLINDAINGLVSSVGDVYTSYVDSEGTDEFNKLVGGTYEGIGCTIQLQETGIVVMEVFANSPAIKAGLQSGDVVLKIDGKDVKKMGTEELANYIKTKSSSKIEMTVLREKKELDLMLERDKVETPVVNSALYIEKGKTIGYLSISMFTSSAFKQFKEKLEDLETKGIKGLVIDVRNNSGGYLSTVTDIVSELLPKGKIIYQVEKNGKREITKDKTNTHREYPIVVLANESSASASEILAAAIKESYGGYLVGTKTYGKGTVQQTKELSDGSMIKYTVENWLTPDGNWINEKGVEPTNEVNLTDDYYNNPIIENDSQLQKGLELVVKKYE